MQTDAAVWAWVARWLQAWPAGDVDTIASAYTDDARYASHPFRPPESARSYVTRAFGEESFVDAWFGEPVVSGDRAAIEYWAVLAADGAEMTIAGAAFLRFDRDGRVVEHRDYWDETGGRRTPPAGWGR